ncbi:SycD/LcrH family type III secretion system chaperone [Candidatus Sororendozoicomonas aggregata]|uniref:SycD/LcrH family type III secretion system chaperone n=1 Tax=Candidatus Sororendozoicomonas aggregata TaxID=3073239 RepID=UPI002ED3DEB5
MATDNKKKGDEKQLDEAVMDHFIQGGTFKDLQKMSDESMEAIYSVAYSLYQSGKYDEAVQIFQFLCFYDHFNKKYFLGLGACQQMLKKYSSAIEIFTLATVLDADDPRAMVYLGDCYLATDNREKAQEAYETAIEWAGSRTEYAGEKERAKTMLGNIQRS